MRLKVFCLLFNCIFSLFLSAQNVNKNRVPLAAVQFLTVSPDARSGAMGDVGVALDIEDANALFWNPARLGFGKKQWGVSASYSPWLRNLIDDMALLYISGYKRFDKTQTLGLSLTYFDLGTIQFTNNVGANIGTFNSIEYALSGSYIRELSQSFSLGISLKYVFSNLAGNFDLNGAPTTPGSTAAGDIGFFKRASGDQNWNFSYGLMISNVGGKIAYGGTKGNFMPANFRIGTSATHIQKTSRFTLSLDVNKLLVPTPPIRDDNGKIIKGVDPNDISSLSALFTSWNDAPEGISEEIKEFSVSAGGEYSYDNFLFLRAGYYGEDVQKGNRRYVTLGTGVSLSDNKYGIDVAYLVPLSQGHPLANTLRLTLHYNPESASKKKSSSAATN